jgi:hypothetical protein
MRSETAKRLANHREIKTPVTALDGFGNDDVTQPALPKHDFHVTDALTRDREEKRSKKR